MKKRLSIITIVCLAILLTMTVSLGMAQQETAGQTVESTSIVQIEGDGLESPDGDVLNYIPVQGRLTDTLGNPLNGNHTIIFRLYAEVSGGTELCSDTNTVAVTNGLFTSEIWGNCPADINGQQLYLGIQVDGDGEMSPRQPIYATPYAWSLRPGAVVIGTVDSNPILHIENWSTTGRGLRVYAMSQTGVNYGVVGASRSPDGLAGYFYNNGGGIGLSGTTSTYNNFGILGMQSDNYSKDDYTDAYKSGGLFGGVNGVIGISHETERVGAGVYGWAQATTGTSYGVRGVADSTTNGYGVYGHATAVTGNTRGVYGISESTAGRGVYGYTSATTGTTYGVYGDSNSDNGRGVYGVADNAAGGVGVEGESEIGAGVYGKSSSGFGVYGLSASNFAIFGDTQRVDHNYGVYTSDNLYSLNYHTSGAIMQVVQNGGSEPLETGDVVVFTGVVAPADANDPPTILVSKASSANSTTVAGVVYARYALAGETLEGAAKPGESLLIVVQGPAQVKTSAAAGAIQVGDLLSSSDQAGIAACAARITIEGIQTVLPGTVFAKALEALESGEGWIYVFVTLQ